MEADLTTKTGYTLETVTLKYSLTLPFPNSNRCLSLIYTSGAIAPLADPMQGLFCL